METQEATLMASAEETQAAVRPETGEAKTVIVGGRSVRIQPLSFRWQVLFWKKALALFEAETASVEMILKSLADNDVMFNYSGELIAGETSSLDGLPDAAAVILASQNEVPPAKIDEAVAREAEWLRDNSNIEELRALVDAQADVEKMVQRVGERWPARFAWLLNLAGVKDANRDSLTQLLTNLFSKSPATSTGAGN